MIVSHKWLAEYLGTDTPSPEKIEELFTFHAFEVEGQEAVGDDTAIDVKVLPNRGSDCLSHRGIARELATVLGVPMTYDPLATEPTLVTTDEIVVNIADAEACPRFTAAVITGVTVGESPAWLKERLATLGQRSINNIVDATNYVMYAIGQPLHAYDADLFPKVNGKWRFGVRFGAPGEKVSLLAEGGKNEDRIITCQGTELLIVDESRNTPIGLAGVKGGAYAGVHAGTKSIIIEAAHFDPAITRKTARRLGIVIDASKRFENRPSPALPLYAQRDIIDLIIKIAGGTCTGVVDIYPVPYVPATVSLKVDHVNRVLGLSLSEKEVSAILERAGIMVVATGDALECTGPLERTDLLIPEDLIEEVARLHGFEHVTSVVPETVPLAEINVRHYYGEAIRARLLELGFSEVITSSFRDNDEIQLLNALATDKSCLRSSLIKNITEVLDKNAGFTDLLGTKDTRVFEIGNVFRKEKSGKGIVERTVVTLGVRIRPSGYSGKEDAVMQEVMKELEALLGATLNAKAEKGVAEFDLTTLLETLPKPTAYAPAPASVDAVYRPFSVYPSISRDIALWVTAAATKESVQAVIEGAAGPLRVRTTFMDEFVKDGRTSYAFRLVFQADDRTLTDEEVEKPMQEVYAAVAKEGWEVR